ncbi:hypothetical protein [Microbacterium sp.]|uniref:hypothetical protein n=1 Tax=Microbacterium sp. TaxID=51671 RepID=UPI0028119C35|nr:hypothetical protein [Microbacterium sp.]
MEAIHVFTRVDGEREVLPSDPSVHVRTRALLAGRHQDELRLALSPPRRRGVRVGALEPEGAEDRIELRDAARASSTVIPR